MVLANNNLAGSQKCWSAKKARQQSGKTSNFFNRGARLLLAKQMYGSVKQQQQQQLYELELELNVELASASVRLLLQLAQ